MSNIITDFPSSGTITGTADDDIIIVQEGSSTVPGHITNAGAGNDVVFGDHDEIFFDNATVSNTSIATATSIDDSGRWSTKENPDVGDTSVPYTSILAKGDGGADFYAVTIGAGETITLDMDYAFKNNGNGSFDSFIELQDANGTVVASDNHDSLTNSGRGSVSSLDSFLTWTNDTGSANTFYINVRELTGTGVLTGDTYMLNVSVTNHANSNVAAFGDDVVNGEAGDDVLYGLAGNDTIDGGADDDTIFGGTGNDLLDGGSGADMIDGGAGQDTVSYENAGSGALRVSLGGTAGIGGQSEGDVLSNIEHATGSNFADQIIGSGVVNTLRGLDGDDTIFGNGGDDLIEGGDNDDILVGGSGADTLDGGDGIDTARYASSTAVVVDLSLGQGSGGEAAGDTLTGIENVAGSQFGDTLIGNTGANVFDGLGGNDAFLGGLGADMINGDLGFDTAFYNDSTVGVDIGLFRDGTGGTAEGDVLRGVEGLFGSDFADTLVGSGAYALVTLSGGAGDDLLFDYGGAALMFGGAGNDTMIGRLGADAFDGGDDIDVVRYADAVGAVNANLATGMGTGADAQGDTYVNVENLVGSIFFDTLTGDDGVNNIRGGAGRDTITGGGGNDQLYGEADLDTFVFDSLDWGDDLIFDFDANPGREQLDFSATSLEFSDFTITDTAFGLRIDYADITAADGFSSIALANVEVSQITADDFIFAV